MIDKFCNWLTEKIKGKMPEVDEEKEAIISFGVFLLFRRVAKDFSFIYIRIFTASWMVFNSNLFLASTISQFFGWISLENTLGMHVK